MYWHRNYISVGSDFFMWWEPQCAFVLFITYLPVGFLNLLEPTFVELNITSCG